MLIKLTSSYLEKKKIKEKSLTDHHQKTTIWNGAVLRNFKFMAKNAPKIIINL